MKKEIETLQVHPFLPIYDKDSQILILGTFPSVKSRENLFYYGHPKNRFWPLLAELFKENIPLTIPEKKSILRNHGIALWDVIKSCDITGSSDNSIKNVVANDFQLIFKNTKIHSVYANGAKAFDLYMKYAFSLTNVPIKKLPSTSPANAAFSMERLKEFWNEIL